MKTLKTNKIIEIVQACQSFAPNEAVRAVAEKIIQDVKEQELVVTTADETVLTLKKQIEFSRSLISADYWKTYENTNLFIIPEPLCNAYADVEENAIIIFDGLFHLLIFRMSTAIIIAELRKKIDVISERYGLTPSELSWLSFQALSLCFHFLQNPKPLPNLLSEFRTEVKEDAYVAYIGGLSFVLFHELGHIVHKHGVDRYGKRSMLPPTLAYKEEVDLHKSWEFEADRYAIEALTPEFRSLGIANAAYVLSLFSDFELFFGSNRHTHPLTINRLTNINQGSKTVSNPDFFNIAEQMLNETLTSMLQLQDVVTDGKSGVSGAVKAGQSFSSIISENEAHDALRRLLEFYQLVR